MDKEKYDEAHFIEMFAQTFYAGSAFGAGVMAISKFSEGQTMLAVSSLVPFVVSFILLFRSIRYWRAEADKHKPRN